MRYTVTQGWHKESRLDWMKRAVLMIPLITLLGFVLASTSTETSVDVSKPSDSGGSSVSSAIDISNASVHQDVVASWGATNKTNESLDGDGESTTNSATTINREIPSTTEYVSKTTITPTQSTPSLDSQPSPPKEAIVTPTPPAAPPVTPAPLIPDEPLSVLESTTETVHETIEEGTKILP